MALFLEIGSKLTEDTSMIHVTQSMTIIFMLVLVVPRTGTQYLVRVLLSFRVVPTS